MAKHIPVENRPTEEQVPVRRRQGARAATTTALSITVPIQLNETLEELVVVENSSKSLVISRLLAEALAARNEKKG